jgi:DNA modification methylase
MEPFVSDPDFTLYVGDVREVLAGLPDESVQCVVTSPPYLDARADVPGFTAWAPLFHELRRVCTGPMVFNVGRRWVDGAEWLWWLDVVSGAERSGLRLLDTLVWLKPNANPIHGRIFADSHEYVLIFGDRAAQLNVDAVRTEYAPESIPRLRRRWINGRGVKGDDRHDQDGRTVNELGARARSFAVVYVGREKGNPHPTPMPVELAEDLIAVASWPGQKVLDPFVGSGTTAIAARRLGRCSVGIEFNQEYAKMCARRLSQQSLLAEEVA